VFEADFTAGSLTWKGTRSGTRGRKNKVSSVKELTEVGGIAKVIEGGWEEGDH
jgi:hypothetical protein